MTTARSNEHRGKTLALAVLTALAAVAVLALGVVPSGADDSPEPISARPLTGRHAFTDDVSAQIKLKPEGRPREVVNLRDASNLAVLEITVQPGARFPWHTHPGPVTAAVTQGELVYVYADDCVERPYPAGKAFVDPGGSNVHTAFNPGEVETVVIATFYDAPATGPLTLPVDAQQGAALDARCGMGAAASSH